MTRARYSASDNTLKEISQMEKPICINGISSNLCSSILGKDCSCEIYKKHIASLRAIPCHDSCRGLWKEGDVLTEYVHYVVRDESTVTNNEDGTQTKNAPAYVAFPLVPVKSEEKEMWMDAITLAMNALAEDAFTPGRWLEVVKQKYTITRKQ